MTRLFDSIKHQEDERNDWRNVWISSSITLRRELLLAHHRCEFLHFSYIVTSTGTVGISTAVGISLERSLQSNETLPVTQEIS